MRVPLAALAVVAAAPLFAADVETEFFENKVRPLLVQHCYQCHSTQAKSVRGGLLLDTRDGWARGGDVGPAIVPGKPDESLLVQSVRYDGELKMPPKGKLPAADIATLTEWVKRGAHDPRTAAAPAKPHGPDPTAAKTHWSFQPLADPAPPAVQNAAWGRTAIDRFILAKQEAAGVAPNGPADRRTLARRLSFDLTGLPPDPDRVDRFAKDDSPDAAGRYADELLASPAFGERWARHWLDLARFAESHGYEQDYDRPNAWPYRDFVVKAFNDDLPFTTFVRWQIAGDELAELDPQAWFATGFLGAGTHATQITANQAEKERYDELDDMVRTVGTTMLGLTVGCARCHDHKYDPIASRDYYRLAAAFSTTVRNDRPFTDIDRAKYEKAKAAYVIELAELIVKREATPAGPERKKLDKAVEAKQKAEPKPFTAMVCSENVPAVRLHTQGADFYDPVHVLKRGDCNQKAEPATLGYLPVLSRAGEERWPATPTGRTPGRRAALARWLTDADAGAGQMLARVIVNRLWQHTFGRGLVATPSDFGLQGERPTHPDLLDFLARELIRHDWHLKPVLRLIVTSAAYGQSGAFDERRASRDRDNKLLWRQPPRRLEAEAIRDAMLAVSGTLDPTPGGPGSLDPLMTRRSLYFTVKRSKLVATMTLFDAPDSLTDQPQRPVTTVAPQALWLLNNAAVRRSAVAFAERVRRDGDPIRQAYRLALGREPQAAERTALAAFVSEQAAAYGGDAGKAWADAMQAVLCLNEFVYVE